MNIKELKLHFESIPDDFEIIIQDGAFCYKVENLVANGGRKLFLIKGRKFVDVFGRKERIVK
jgi:hypothetical protein